MALFLLTLRRAPFSFPKIGDPKIYTQTLDHFNPNDKRKFKQRFYENTKFGNESAPRLIVYIGGEAPLTDKYTQTGSYIDLANKTQSFVVSLEHRYFGETQPFDELTAKNLEYLTSDQALADLAEFIEFYKSKRCRKHKCPVLVVGGSYPGTLSAWFRIKYPHIASFSWSSSAPLLAKNNFTEYDSHVADILKRTSENCYTNSKKLMDEFNKYPSLLEKGIDFGNSTDETSHLSIISDFLAGIIQYDNSYHLLKPYCDGQEKEASMENFFKSFNEFLNLEGQSAQDMDDLLVDNFSAYSDYATGVAWTWMTCNEFGWYQTASGKFRPAKVNLDYSEKICQKYFQRGISHSIDQKNIQYGAKNPRGTLTFFTNGDTDPWSEMSVEPFHDDSSSMFSIRIHEGSHCSDLHSDSEKDPEDLRKKRAIVLETMESWLTSTCNNTCQGECILERCVCRPGFYGPDCSRKHVTEFRFKVFTTLVVVMPTLMMIIIGLAAWCLFKKDRDDADIKTIQ